MLNTQTGKCDFTLLHNGKIYRFPTESERWEFLREEAKENDTLGDTILVGIQPTHREGLHA